MMRYGFTTGSCAAAASKAAAYMLLTGKLNKYNNTDTERGFCFKRRYLKLQEVKQKLPAQYEKMVEMIPILHPGHSFFTTVRFGRWGEKSTGVRIQINFQAFM